MNTGLRRPDGRAIAIAAIFVLYAATSPIYANDRPVVVPQVSPGELQNLQNRQQRQNFQQRQQINRELDNLSVRQRQPRVEVPIMKPSCKPQQFGISC